MIERTSPGAPALAVATVAALTACGSPPAPPGWCVPSATGEDRVQAATIRDEAEARAVMSRGGGRWGDTARLVEAWRAGGVEGEAVLAGPLLPSVGPGGQVAVPDARVGEVVTVGPDGEWRGPLVTRGPGPDEVRWPVAVAWRDGDRLAVFDLGAGEVLEVAVPEGERVGGWRLPEELYGRIAATGELPGTALSPDGSLLLELPWTAAEGGDRGTRLATLVRVRPPGGGAPPSGRRGAAAARVDTVVTVRARVLGGERFSNAPRPGTPRPLFASGPGGALAVAGEAAVYRIRILTAPLRDSLVLCRDAGPPPPTPEERGEVSDDDSLPSAVADRIRRIREVGPVSPPLPFGRLFFGEEGRLWVQRTRPDPLRPGAPAEGGPYDVFAPGGEFLGTVRAPERTVLFGESSGRVYGLERGPLDAWSVVAYRLGP